MIISKKKYDSMCSLIIKQREAIKLLEEQTFLLKKICKNSIYGATHCSDIDFPNSDHKTYNGYVDKFI